MVCPEFGAAGRASRECLATVCCRELVSALFVALGAQIADPIIGLAITSVILKITWDSWRTVRHAEIDLDHIDDDHHDHHH